MWGFDELKMIAEALRNESAEDLSLLCHSEDAKCNEADEESRILKPRMCYILRGQASSR